MERLVYVTDNAIYTSYEDAKESGKPFRMATEVIKETLPYDLFPKQAQARKSLRK